MRPDVFLVVFHSTKPDAGGGAMYIRATAREPVDEASIRTALACLASRKNEAPKPHADFTGVHPRRAYQAVPDAIWTNVLEEESGYYFDERVTSICCGARVLLASTTIAPRVQRNPTGSNSDQ
jgi:hypothetical protein